MRHSIFCIVLGLWCWVVISGCDDGPEPPVSPDGSLVVGELGRLTVGAGDPLVDFSDGAEVAVDNGCQGGAHIFVSLRVENEREIARFLAMQMELLREDGSVERGTGLRGMDQAPEGSDAAQLLDFLFVISDDVSDGRPLGPRTLRVTVAAPDARRSTVSRNIVLIAGGEDDCGS